MVMAVDEAKLGTFLGQFVADLGATANAAMVVIGHRLGLYRALADAPPLTAADLAARTGTTPRYVAEWLAAQTASGYVTVCHGDHFTLSAEQAFALADPDGPLYLQDNEVFDGCEQFFAPGYRANLVSSWIPALDGTEAKLRQGALVADVGCGHGASTRIMAEAFPASRFTGFDYHARSVERAGQAAADAGLSDRVRFAVASATEFPGAGYDLITTFDCLHDMGQPAAAAGHIRQALSGEGTWLLVEPAAADDLAGNLNPVGRLYYAFSTLLCVPNALAQEPAVVLGNQAGEARLRGIVAEAGFTRFRRAAETPFNLVFEVRP
jgi:SAM-dependent methyltransferase